MQITYVIFTIQPDFLKIPKNAHDSCRWNRFTRLQMDINYPSVANVQNYRWCHLHILKITYNQFKFVTHTYHWHIYTYIHTYTYVVQVSLKHYVILNLDWNISVLSEYTMEVAADWKFTSQIEFVNRLDERLECPICRNVFIEPWQTSCGHRFCKNCFEDLFG